MRLILLVPAFPKLSETFIVSKFLGLLESGWDVHVVCGKSELAEWTYFPELQHRSMRSRVHVTWPVHPRWMAVASAPVVAMHCALHHPRQTWQYLHRGAERFGKDVLRKMYLDARLISLSPDLIHFEFGALAAQRMYLKDVLGCRMVVSFRGYDLNYVGLEDPGYYEAVWQDADALHLLGQGLWRRALRRGCPPYKPHALIPPAIDTAYFDPGDRTPSTTTGTSEQPLNILSVGRLAWEKGYEYALQAVQQLRDQGLTCRYTIVGDGAYLEAIAFARYQLGLDDVVLLAGALPHHEVKSRMQEADVFLHAAVSEGFCNAVLEAQAMKLPVVCSDADGLPENVADGETGFVVPRRDPQALAQKLALLANNPALRQRMGEAGRRRVLKHFQIGEQIGRFSRFYEETLAKAGEGGRMALQTRNPDDAVAHSALS